MSQDHVRQLMNQAAQLVQRKEWPQALAVFEEVRGFRSLRGPEQTMQSPLVQPTVENLWRFYRQVNVALCFVLWPLLMMPFLLYSKDEGTICVVGTDLKWPVQCLSQRVLQRPCWACGMTRSWVALYHDQYAEAKRYHCWGPLVCAWLWAQGLSRLWLAGASRWTRPWIWYSDLLFSISTCVAIGVSALQFALAHVQ